MITAVDTNVIVALWRGTEDASAAAATALAETAAKGSLIVSPAVYAELLATPGWDAAALDEFLNQAQISVDWILTADVWRAAAQAYRGYAERRRAQRHDPGPRRILADFIIGAHALHTASALLTLDQGVYQASFPSLTVFAP